MKGVWIISILLGVLVVSGGAAFAQGGLPAPRRTLEEIGRTTYEPMSESSGMVASRGVAWLFWVINDSLNPPNLYVIDRSGRCYADFEVKAPNLDWEALAIDGQGRLYIGDVGNNAVMRGLRMRQVYRLAEPDLGKIIDRSAAEPVKGTLEPETVYIYTFAGQPFDVEAMFVRQGHLYLVSKVGAGQTGLYEVDLAQPGVPRPLREVCRLPRIDTVTDASLSPDGTQLALCSYAYVAVYALAGDEPIERLGRKVPTILRFDATSTEACAWAGNEELLLAAEGRPIYRLRIPPVSTRPVQFRDISKKP